MWHVAALLLLLARSGSLQDQQKVSTTPVPTDPNIVVSSVQVETAPLYVRKPQNLTRPRPSGRTQRQLGADIFYNYGVNDGAGLVDPRAAYVPSYVDHSTAAFTFPSYYASLPSDHPGHGHSLRYDYESPAELRGFSASGTGNLASSSFPRFLEQLGAKQSAGFGLLLPSRPARPSAVGRPSGPSGPSGFSNPSGPSAFGFSGPGLTGFGGTQCQQRVPTCDPLARYRTLDGSCNNIKNPTWGMAGTIFTRLLPPRYADGVQAPLDNGLPLPRLVSYTLFPDVEIADPTWTVAAMQWSQLVTHDMSMAAGSRQHKPHAIRCCAQDGHDVVNNLAEQAGCYPVRIPPNDPFYSRFNQRCMDFVRSSSDVANGCSNGPAQQMTAVTSYLDLSVVYGSSDDTLRGLREFRGGRLIVDRRKGRDWLPPSANRSADCETADDSEPCYRSGDVRVNQNPGQALLQTLLLREHNRLAGVLSKLNSHWDDETLLQEARKINAAQIQQITYYEWLPILLGGEETLKRGLVQTDPGYSQDYDEGTDATAINDHATGAFRHLHTLIPSHLLEINTHRHGEAALRLSDVFNRPAVIEVGRSLDQLVRGLATQPQHAPDRFFSAEITQFLFRANKPFGGDLRSIDIQRGRDHGLPGYNDYRQLCGLPRAVSFHDFSDVMDPEAAAGLAELYAKPDDVDMLVGGGLERNAGGALAGPTFVCIMAEQFRRTRQGDRFWFELDHQPGSFTPGQLQELRKASLARLMCDNGDGIHAMQLRAFQQVGFRNPVVSCSDVPEIDLTFWDAHDPADLPQ